MRILFFLILSNWLYGQVTPLPNAHAHNDYEHDRPLLDALAQGFTSVEADVHLIDGELYVYHDRPAKPDPTRTLTRLYLQPLQKLASENGGTGYPNYIGDFYLMIDFKTNAEATYVVLKAQLQPFVEMLTRTEKDVQKKGAVTIFISGNRPTEMVKAENIRLAGIDGRPGDVNQYDAAFMPVISDSFRGFLKWNGKGEIPSEELEKLQQLTAAAHAKGQKVRLWATPEDEKVWKVLQKAGVDLLNTDELERLKVFLLKQKH